MANQLPLLENLTPKDIQDLMDSCISFDAKNILGPEYEDVISYNIPRLKLSWKNKKEFEKDIKFITSASSIAEANKILEKKFLETSGSKEKENAEANTPDKWAREQQESERVIREETLKETRVQAEKEVRESIEKKQQIYESQKLQTKLSEVAPKEIREKVLSELGDKTVYAVPEKDIPEIQFNAKEAEFVELAKNDPVTFSQKLSELIIQQNPEIPQETLVPLAQAVAADTTIAIVDPTAKVLPTGVFSSVAQASDVVANLSPDTVNEVAKSAAIFTSFSESQETLYRSVLNKAVGQNITNSVLGVPEQTYVLTYTPSDKGYRINLGQLQSNSYTFQQSPSYNMLNDPLTNNAKSYASNKLKGLATSKIQSLATKGAFGNISKFATSKAFDSIAPFIGMQTNFTYVGTNVLGKAITTFFPQFAPLMSSIASRLGINIGISAIAPVAGEAAVVGGAVTAEGAANVIATGAKVAGKGLNVALGNALAKGASWLLGKVGATALAAKVGAMVGTGVLPVIGTIIGAILGAVLGKLLQKIPWKKIAPFLLGGLIGGAVFAFIGPVAGVVAGVAAFGATAAAGGSITLAGIGGGIASVFAAIGGLFVSAFLGPFLITIMGLVISTAFILFVINSGAYVVPATSSGGGGTNITCDVPPGEKIPDNSAATAAVCIVSYLNQYGLNPLTGALIGSTPWQSLKSVLPNTATHELEISATYLGWLQCVGFTSATAGYAYGQGFSQISACSYIKYPPAGYSYISGTSGMKPGDFFLMGDPVFGCTSTSPNHIGVVVSIDGTLISCADANAIAKGMSRAQQGCYALSQITGYLRKQ